MKSKAPLFLAAAAAVIIAAFLLLRHPAGQDAAASRQAPSVAVAVVGRRDLFEQLTIQAEFRPYLEVQLYSKVAGYLKSIPVDFGDRVKKGDTIAVIEVPELGDELNQAIAAGQRAEADYRDAHLDWTRLSGVNQSQPNLVSQQDLDAAEARDHATEAALAAAKADVEKYRTLVSYTRITAPFDGVVTARYADPGAMIQTASSSQTGSLPLVRLSENQLLRLDFPVSVSYAQDIKEGDPVDIVLESGSRFTEKITRFSRKVDLATRTMETEVEVPNPDLKLIPGMYATIGLRLHQRPNALVVPVQAVGAGNSPTVYRVAPDGTVEERTVKLGIESPDYYEVLDGLTAGDRVVTGGRSGIQPGEKVVPHANAALQAAAPQP